MNSFKFEIECKDYRTLHIPNTEDSNSKLGTLFARVEDIPEGLLDWMDVNPRNPKYSKTEKLSGAVARSIVRTLEDEPEIFSLKNLGIYLLVEEVTSERISGDRHHVKIVLSDKTKHGIVNGGHTYSAIRQVIDSKTYVSGAFVRLHLYMNIPENNIVELAEGLNKNLQVNNTSLSNLIRKFDLIKDAMADKKGASEIAYADGDQGSIDILEILHILSCFDLESYPSNTKYPNDIFGSKQKILNRYCEDIEEKNSSYRKLSKNIHEFLVLSDEVQKQCAAITSYYKIKNTADENRVGSENHKRNAVFGNGVIGGYIPQGWLYPMLSAFRANLSMQAWKEGKIEWLTDPFILLEEIINKLAEVVTTQHKEHKNKPGEVGRKSTAYDQCYSAAFMALAVKGKIGISQ